MKNLEVQTLLARIAELEKEIESLKSRKKYGLVWEQKDEDVVLECQNNIPILKEVESRKIVLDKNAPTNILIEGDNYHSLSVLNYTHQGKVDVIYIDPPYNTGNKDFTYNDDYVDREDGYKNSKWLSFLEKRLVLAKNLLSERGVIFISIDDNEQSQLKLLCDSVFGNKNFLNNFIWINNLKGRQISDFGASKTYEYILAYSLNSNNVNAFEGDSRELKKLFPDVYKNKDYEIFEDEYGKYILKNELYNSNSDFNEETRSNLVFDIFYNPNTKDIKFEITSKDKGYKKISPNKNNNGTHKYHAWRWSKEKIINESYNLAFLEDDGEFKIFTKIRDIYTTTIKDLISNISTNSGGSELKKILGTKKFTFPKPVDLIKFIIGFSTEKNSVILDFMAGSGTTGHAVLELNKKDGGNRQFILCTNNENKICEEVTYERLKRVMKGYKNKKGGTVEGLGENLRYLRAELVSKAKHRDTMKFRLTKACTEMLCLKEGIFEFVSQKDNKETKEPIYKIIQGHTANGPKVMGIYFDIDDSQIDEMLLELKKHNATKIAYIFSLSGYGYEIEDKKKWQDVSIEPIPQKILEIYEEIFKVSKKK